ncbi:hypothetical protein K8Q93_03795 [Candidatus Parcubacteria bacterium]|nr:hypothetical protein [Candidatus Parcubacteria bacterium]
MLKLFFVILLISLGSATAASAQTNSCNTETRPHLCICKVALLQETIGEESPISKEDDLDARGAHEGYFMPQMKCVGFYIQRKWYDTTTEKWLIKYIYVWNMGALRGQRVSRIEVMQKGGTYFKVTGLDACRDDHYLGVTFTYKDSLRGDCDGTTFSAQIHKMQEARVRAPLGSSTAAVPIPDTSTVASPPPATTRGGSKD